MRRKGELPLADLLVTICSGGMWTWDRCCEEGYDVDPVCPLCQQEPGSLHHICWRCPAVAAAGLQSIEASRHLERQANEQERSCPAFWSRGLMPLAWLH